MICTDSLTQIPHNTQKTNEEISEKKSVVKRKIGKAPKKNVS
jgi:hypothetical protein